MTARNDNYGGQLIHRIQASIDSIVGLAERAGLNSELLIVEWNPPGDQLSLAAELEIPEDTDHVSVRLIKVPPEIHSRIPNAGDIPLFEYRAKNVGIRRSKGKFILSTNPDLIYSPELITYLSGQNLDTDQFYRIHRYDIERPVPLSLPLDERLEFAEKHVYRIATVSDGFVEPKDEYVTGALDEIRAMLRSIRSEPKKLLKPFLKPAETLETLSNRYESLHPEWSYGDEDENRGRKASSPPDTLDEAGLFLFASGDFLLMSRDAWCEMRGYPELDSNLHVDSLGCIYARKYGLNQTILKDPLRIYHQEHDRSERNSRPASEWETIVQEGNSILGNPTFEPCNGKSWGLSGYSLEEKVLS